MYKKIKQLLILAIVITIGGINFKSQVYADSISEEMELIEEDIINDTTIRVSNYEGIRNFRWQIEGQEEIHNNLNIDVENGIGKIKMYYIDNKNNSIEEEVFYYSNYGYTFLCEKSEDAALGKGIEYLLENDIIDDNEAKEIFNDYYENHYKEPFYLNTPSTISNNGTRTFNSVATGYISLEHYGDSLASSFPIIPFKFAKIELYAHVDGESTLVGEGYTDENGYFEIEYENMNVENYGLHYRLYTHSYSFSVLTASIYFAVSDIIHNVNDGDTTYFGSVYYPYATDNLSDAFYIHQAMIMGQELVRNVNELILKVDNDVNSEEYNKLAVFYPFEGTSFSYAGFCLIEEIDSSVSNRSIYDEANHEYGHFIEQIMGVYAASLLEIIKNDPNHLIKDDNFTVKPEKEYAMKLTWSESWSNAFSLIAQMEMIDDNYRHCMNFMHDLNEFENIITHPSNSDYINNRCEAQEYAVSSFLWDLYDDPDMYDSNPYYETGDNISMSAYEWFNSTTRNNSDYITILSDFTDSIIRSAYSKCKEVFEVLAQQRIAPKIHEVLNYNLIDKNTEPIIKFSVGGSISHPNNQFEVVVFNNQFQEINKTTITTSVTDPNLSFEFTIPNSFWISLKNILNNHQTIYLCIAGYLSSTPTSGPYYSNFIELSIEYDHLCLYNKRYVSNGDGQSHTAYCDCGKTRYEICDCDFNIPGVTVFKCTKCRQRLNFIPVIRDPERMIDIKKEEEENDKI